MFSFFKRNKNQLYTDLPPGKRIEKIVRDHIAPPLIELGFNLSKTDLELKRKVGDFEQSIQFQKSRNNNTNQMVRFSFSFSVCCKNYEIWYKETFGEKLSNTYSSNSITFSSNFNYIPNWTNTKMEDYWYDLAVDDNLKISSDIIEKIIKVALPYIENFSNWNSVFEALMTKDQLKKTALLLDFCEMRNDTIKAQEVLRWFENHPIKPNLDSEILSEIQKRIERL